MDKKQTLEMLDVLQAAYPAFYSGKTGAELSKIANLWWTMFADDNPALVGAAVKAIITESDSTYPPNIGVVKEKMRQLTAPNEMSEAEAWNLIAKAIRNSGYDSKKEFEKLPPVLQKIVGSPSQLRDWGMMDSETVHSVVASNVQRAFRTVSKRENELAKLPSDVKAIIGGLTEKMRLTDGTS